MESPHYQEEDLETVIRIFAKGFNHPTGYKIRSVEHFVDVTKSKVIFKIWLDEEPPKGKDE